MFEFHCRVYYEDTDVSGVVYHARYLAFFERCRTEFLRSLGFDQQNLIETQHIAFTISKLDIRYRLPAKLDDELKIGVAVEKASPASVQFRQNMVLRHQPQTVLAQLNVRVACVSYPSFELTRMPPAVHDALREQQTHVI